MARKPAATHTVPVDGGSVNPRIVAEFWRDALDWHIVDVNEEGAIEIGPRDHTDLSLLFEPPTQPKVTKKSRIHFIPRQHEHATDLRRLLELGARQVEAEEGDRSWIVLADPEGNEFYLLHESVDERRPA